MVGCTSFNLACNSSFKPIRWTHKKKGLCIYFPRSLKVRFLFPYYIVGFSQSCWQHTSHEYIMQRLVFSVQFSSPPFQPSSQVSAHRTFKRPSLAFHITQIFYWYWQTLISLTSLREEKKKAAKPVPSLLFFFRVHMSKWGNVSFGPGDFSDLDPRHSICLLSLELLSALCLGVYWWRLGANLNKLSKLLFFSGETLRQ